MEPTEALELATRWLDIVSMYSKEYQRELEAAAVLRRLIPFVEAALEYAEWSGNNGHQPFPHHWPLGLRTDTVLVRAYYAFSDSISRKEGK